MFTIGARDAKSQLAQLLDRVAAGEQILITRKGQPAALLSAPPESSDVDQVIKAMIQFRDTEGPTLGDDVTIQELIDAGRE